MCFFSFAFQSDESPGNHSYSPGGGGGALGSHPCGGTPESGMQAFPRAPLAGLLIAGLWAGLSVNRPRWGDRVAVLLPEPPRWRLRGPQGTSGFLRGEGLALQSGGTHILPAVPALSLPPVSFPLRGSFHGCVWGWGVGYRRTDTLLKTTVLLAPLTEHLIILRAPHFKAPSLPSSPRLLARSSPVR